VEAKRRKLLIIHPFLLLICNNRDMTGTRMGRCFLPVAAWIGIILFSSTSSAGNWCAGVFQLFSAKLLGLFPNQSWGILAFLAEKGVHVILFLVLGTLLWKGIRAIEDVPRKIAVILSIGLLIGSASEFLQRFFPGRDPSVRDVLINLGSTAIGVALSLTFARSRQNELLRAESEV
jgi:VanZ family protein